MALKKKEEEKKTTSICMTGSKEQERAPPTSASSPALGAAAIPGRQPPLTRTQRQEGNEAGERRDEEGASGFFWSVLP